jgi:glucose/arabinose dehydrogenase
MLILWPRLYGLTQKVRPALIFPYSARRQPNRGLRKSLSMFVLVMCLLSGLSNPSDVGAESYVPAGDKRCHGFPRLALQSLPGTCVGLVARNLGFPRGLHVLSDDSVLVADMGGWDLKRGRLLKISFSEGSPATTQVLARRLDRPNSLAQTADGRIWLSEATRISEVSLGPNGAAFRPIMTGAPGNGRHPLIGLAALPDGRLVFSTGSATDDCDVSVRKRVCSERLGPQARGAVRLLTPKATSVAFSSLSPFAIGLRNSLAMDYDPDSKTLWGADNGQDLSSPRLPPDELNRISEGKDYGWPFCYGMRQPSPGVGIALCRQSELPALNLPPHGAPLSLRYTRSGLVTGDRRLIISLHSYMQTGHRIIDVPLSSSGQLNGPIRDLIWNWEAVRGRHPKGTPVGLAILSDGSVLISEDGNGSLLILAPETP